MIFEQWDINIPVKENLSPFLVPQTTINVKWITYLNAKSEFSKISRSKHMRKCDFGVGKDFLDDTPKERFVKEKHDKLDFIKIKNFLDIVKIIKRQATDWERM